MSVTHDATGVAGLADSGLGNKLWTGSITISAGLTNSILVVALNVANGPSPGVASAVRLDSGAGTLLTQLGTVVSFGATANVQIFYLLNPPSGAHSIFVEVASGDSNGGAVMSSWSGVDQVTPFDTEVSNTFNAVATATLNPTAPSGDVIISAFGNQFNDTTPTQGAGETALGIVAGKAQGSAATISVSSKPGSGASSVTWNAAPNGATIAGAMAAVGLKSAGGGGGLSPAVIEHLHEDGY